MSCNSCSCHQTFKCLSRSLCNHMRTRLRGWWGMQSRSLPPPISGKIYAVWGQKCYSPYFKVVSYSHMCQPIKSVIFRLSKRHFPDSLNDALTVHRDAWSQLARIWYLILKASVTGLASALGQEGDDGLPRESLLPRWGFSFGILVGETGKYDKLRYPRRANFLTKNQAFRRS